MSPRSLIPCPISLMRYIISRLTKSWMIEHLRFVTLLRLGEWTESSSLRLLQFVPPCTSSHSSRSPRHKRNRMRVGLDVTAHPYVCWSGYQKSTEHIWEINEGVLAHPLVAHFMEEHDGVRQKYLMRIIGCHQTALERQVNESVLIENLYGFFNILLLA